MRYATLCLCSLLPEALLAVGDRGHDRPGRSVPTPTDALVENISSIYVYRLGLFALAMS